MNGLWIHLLRPYRGWAALWLSCLLGLALVFRGIPYWALIAIASVSLARQSWQCRFVFRLVWRTRRFRRVSGRDIVLYHSSDLDEFEIIDELLNRSLVELKILEGQFELVLCRPVVVICFANCESIAAIGTGSGFAMPESNTVAISRNGFKFETVRHELTHLLSAKWDRMAPIFLTEGLAVWSQGTWWGQPVDEQAFVLIKEERQSLPDLLKTSHFYDDRHKDSSYILAGSFTGFLIRNYGWENYGKMFRSARQTGVRRALLNHFGRNPEDLERDWRAELRAANWPRLP
jgi:hypothetical protein